MDYKNCCNPQCQKLALTNRFTGLCNDCHEEIFKRIKQYLEDVREQEKATGIEVKKNIHTIATSCKVPDRIVEGYVREGRLENIFHEFFPNIKMCPKCGDIISSDGLCEKCMSNLNNLKQLRDQLNGPKQSVPDFPLPDKESHGMRYFRK